VTTERRFLGVVDVDSGTLIVGDPGYALPWADRGKTGIDYAVVIATDGSTPATQLADGPVVLLQHFGGDGIYPVYGEFEDGEFIRATIEFEPLDDEEGGDDEGGDDEGGDDE
jgi:hypothetical protein